MACEVGFANRHYRDTYYCSLKWQPMLSLLCFLSKARYPQFTSDLAHLFDFSHTGVTLTWISKWSTIGESGKGCTVNPWKIVLHVEGTGTAEHSLSGGLIW